MSPRATPRPMPEPAPVTTATRSAMGAHVCSAAAAGTSRPQGKETMDATPVRASRRGPLARGYAALVVALRHVIPLAWVAAVVAATIALPGLGDVPAAPLDDLAAKGGS